jgi:hypothetical protein
LDDLNRIIVRGPIYDSVRFTNVALSPETRKVLWENPQYGLDLSYLNRLLLQDTYPHEIAKESRFSRDNTPYLRADRDQGMQFLDQLKSALPLQTRSVPLPYETAVGGFTLFNAEGISFLGPDLYGYQGNAVTDGTNDFTVYLVGNNFSVRGTRVLASGAQLNNSVLLSRQLIAATVPGPLIAQAKQVEITVATPYGVSSPITVKPTFTGKATPQTPKTGYTWQVNATNTTSYGIQIFVLTNHVALPTLLANAQDPYPHITRTLSTGTDAVLQPESAALAFKVSVVTDSGEAVIANTNNSSVLQITEGGKLKMFQFANNEMLSPANFCEMVWPQLTNYIGNKLDHYYVSNSLAANVKIKLGTYLRLDTGAVIQTDDPLLLPLSQ